MLWRFIDRPREDSLTASVFSHLLHLPSEVFWQILSVACRSSDFPSYPGEPLFVHAWPNWGAEGTENECRVIPDLVIGFADFDLIVEAKRWDHAMQDSAQWQKELIAYANEYGSKRRSVKMLALGGIHSHDDAPLDHIWAPIEGLGAPHKFQCTVHMCQWSSVLLECRRKKQTMEGMSQPPSPTLAHIRVLNDLIDLFIRHGFDPLRWFDDFQFNANLLNDSACADQSIFRNTSYRFRIA